MMCTADGSGCALAAPGGGFASVADALRVGLAVARYLNSPAAAGLEGAARGEALEALGAITSLLGAAANGLLRRFDADDGHDADGYASAATWLAGKTRLGRGDARAAVRQMRLLARHPLLDAATAAGAITISWAKEIAAWTGRIDHEELQQAADRILVEAAAAGADLDDLKLLAQAAYEAWRAQEPDPEDDPRGRGFGDRYLHLDTTLDGAGPDQGRPDPRVRGRRHRGPGGAGQAPRPGGLPKRRAALPRRPPGGLRAAHPRQDGPRPGRRRHPRRRDHPPVATCSAWTGRRSSRTPGSAPAPASTATWPGRTPRPSPATPWSSRS